MAITDQADRTLWVGNLEPRVTDENLFELFLQAGPLLKVNIPKDKDGRQKNFAFVEFKHDVSVPYAMQLMGGLSLFGRGLRLQFRSGSKHQASSGAMPGTPPIMGPPGGLPRGNGILAPPTGMSGQGMNMPPNIHRSASAPDALFKIDQGVGSSPMFGTPNRGNTGMSGLPIGILPGTPFSQGTAFQGLYSMNERELGNLSPIVPQQGRPPSHTHSSPGATPSSTSYNSPERRGSDGKSGEDNYHRLVHQSRSDGEFGSHFETPSGRGRDREANLDRHGASSYDSETSRYQGHHRGQYEDRGDYGAHHGRESRSDHSRHERGHDRYRDRSGSRSDYDRRGYNESRHHHRNYHTGR